MGRISEAGLSFWGLRPRSLRSRPIAARLAGARAVGGAAPQLLRHGAALVLVALLASGATACAGDSGPPIEELEAAGDVAGLIEAAVAGGFTDRPAEAVDALRRLDDPTTVTLLDEALRTEELTSGEFVTRGSVVAVLGAIGGPAAAQVLVDFLRTSDPFERYWPERDLTWALTAIGADAHELVAPFIEAPVPDDTSPEYRTDAALRRLATEVFGGRAAEDLDPFDRDERIAAPTSVGPIGSDRAEAALLTALGVEPECSVTTDLVYSCTSWGEHASVAMVRRRRADPSPLLGLLGSPATARIAYGLVLLGTAGTEPALVAALQQTSGSTPLGESLMRTYANSGNEVLEEAAFQWRVAFGYTLAPALCLAPPGTECEAVSLWGSIDDET